MVVVAVESPADGFAALAEGRWGDARARFEAALAGGETAEDCFGLAMALWWLGENHACVERCSRAYALFRAAGDAPGAAQCAVWLAITYKANFANFPAANGWLGRAERLLEPSAPGPLHGWVWVARGYRMTDLAAAEELTGRAVEVARAADDVDLELVALAQLGLVRVGKGDIEAGFGLIDEAMAAALAGERSTLDTVVYACCDMLSACELVSDLERAVQWVPGRRRLRRQVRLPVPVRRVPHLLRQRAHRQGALGRCGTRARRRPADHRGRLPRPAPPGDRPVGPAPRAPRSPRGG